MPKKPSRRFTLLDGMIVVGGVGLGIAGYRPISSCIEFSDPDNDYWFKFAQVYASLFLAVASLVLLCSRLASPRPSIRKCFRQPGTVACFAILAYGFASQSIGYAQSLFGPDAGDRQLPLSWTLFNALSPQTEYWYIIPIVWIILALGRISRSEPSWIDRSGRIVGWLWIVWGIVGAFY